MLRAAASLGSTQIAVGTPSREGTLAAASIATPTASGAEVESETPRQRSATVAEQVAAIDAGAMAVHGKYATAPLRSESEKSVVLPGEEPEEAVDTAVAPDAAWTFRDGKLQPAVSDPEAKPKEAVDFAVAADAVISDAVVAAAPGAKSKPRRGKRGKRGRLGKKARGNRRGSAISAGNAMTHHIEG